MSALVIALLAAPVLGVIGSAAFPSWAHRVARTVTATAAAGWVAVAASAAGDPIEVADLTVDAVLAAAACGLALVVLVDRSRTVTGACAGLAALATLPLAGALEVAALPDRRLAAGVVGVAALAVVRQLAERTPTLGAVMSALSGLVIAAGLIGREPGEALVLAVAGTTLAVLGAAVWFAPGRWLLVAGLLAVARIAPLRPAPVDVDRAQLIVAGLVLTGAVVLVVVRMRPVTHRLPLAGVLAGAGLAALDVADLRNAGLVLGAGGVLALAARQPIALAALVPGVAAAVDAAGLPTQPEHAAIGAAVVAILFAGARGVVAPEPSSARPDPLVTLVAVVAVAFAVIPVWGWAGVALDDYRWTILVAAAVALPLLVLGTLLERREALAPPSRPGPETRPGPDAPDEPERPTPPDEADHRSAPESTGRRREPLRAATTPGRGPDADAAPPPGVRIRTRGSRIVARPLVAPTHGPALQDDDSVPEARRRNATDVPPS